MVKRHNLALALKKFAMCLNFNHLLKLKGWDHTVQWIYPPQRSRSRWKLYKFIKRETPYIDLHIIFKVVYFFEQLSKLCLNSLLLGKRMEPTISLPNGSEGNPLMWQIIREIHKLNWFNKRKERTQEPSTMVFFLIFHRHKK